jgi:hypothetical protein
MSDAGTGQVPGLSLYHRGVRDGMKEMKERCAQVAESMHVYGNREIAAAIRALKDKT